MFDINKWRYKLTMNENLSSLLICVLVKKRKISDFYVVHPTSCTPISLSQQIFGSVCWVGTILHKSAQEEANSPSAFRDVLPSEASDRHSSRLLLVCASGKCFSLQWKLVDFHEGKFKNGTSADGRGFGASKQRLGTNTNAQYLSSN